MHNLKNLVGVIISSVALFGGIALAAMVGCKTGALGGIGILFLVLFLGFLGVSLIEEK